MTITDRLQGARLKPARVRLVKDLAEIKDTPKTFAINAVAFFWQTPVASSGMYWVQLGDQRILENRLAGNPPRAARAQALTSIAGYDGSTPPSPVPPLKLAA